MRKFLEACLILSLLLMPISYAAVGGSVVTLDKNEIEKPQIGIQDNSKQINGSLLINSSEDLATLIDTQKEHDLKDLEILWKGTIENNQVIEFALKKLATPESQRRIHSSLMAKTLSAVVTGASFVPSLMGTNYGVQTAAFSAGRLAQGLLNKNNIPKETPLTDTELIELAGMVENLQDALISSYYNYKNTLSLLKDTRSKMLLYSKNYSNALDGKDIMEISISSALYDSMRLREYSLEQSAKKYHIQLQRLAGKKAVDSLELYQYDFDSMLYKDTKRAADEEVINSFDTFIKNSDKGVNKEENKGVNKGVNKGANTDSTKKDKSVAGAKANNGEKKPAQKTTSKGGQKGGKNAKK